MGGRNPAPWPPPALTPALWDTMGRPIAGARARAGTHTHTHTHTQTHTHTDGHRLRGGAPGVIAMCHPAGPLLSPLHSGFFFVK